jgi:2,4-dienoyl-CoA reductase-like NADH-dependent reductase (Old Yellow Enzyme family)
MTCNLSEPLTLPSGAQLTNRISKSPMSEGVADVDNHSTTRFETLYRRWAESGAGLLFTGNIQVDPNHLERPFNIVIHDDGGKEQLARLASAGTSAGAHFWAQLSHTGRKVFSNINSAPLAPSAIALEMGSMVTFPTPRPMTEEDIGHAINQFASAAKAAQEAGFTGVSLHAASAYLIAQFLSPLSNLRTDRWGGSLENRSRFLVEVILAIRAAVGPRFPIGVKLNVFEYQKGGFTSAECVELAKILNGASVDLLELSGTYRLTTAPGSEDSDDARRADAISREAYILPFVAHIRAVAKMPTMVTGGFRTRAAMVEALEKREADVVGWGRPFIADPESPRRLLTGQIDKLLEPDIAMSLNVSLRPLAVLRWNSMQIERLADGLDPDPSLTGDAALAAFFELESRNTRALLEHRMAVDVREEFSEKRQTWPEKS